MLERLIAEAKAQGYTFTTLAPILPPQYVPHHNVPPSLADQATLSALHVMLAAGPNMVLAGMYWFGGSAFVMTGLYLLLSMLNEWRQRRRVWPDLPDDEWPFVSVAWPRTTRRR